MQRYRSFLVVVMTAIPFVYALFLYPGLGDRIPVHFSADGKPDGWGSRDSIFIGPSVLGLATLFVYFLLANIEKIDPKRAAKGDNESIKMLGFFVALLMTLLSCCILYAIAHENTPIDQLLFGLLGLLFLGMGYYMPKLKQNYFAGYRIPWTLESEENWNLTHGVAGKCWMAGGALQVVMAVLVKGTVLFVVFMSITAIITIIPFYFSYRLFKKSTRV